MAKVTGASLDINELVRTKLRAPNVCFMFGAGSSKCVGYPLMGELTEIAKSRAKGNKDISSALGTLTGTTVEEQLEELQGQLRSPKLSLVDEDVLKATVSHILDVIFDECSKLASLDFHRKFVRSVFERVGDHRRIHTFTTNYDMLFEWACDAEMIYCVNGFFGVQCRMFEASQFDIRPARLVTQTHKSRARTTLCPCFNLYKPHGSVSWVAETSGIKEIQVTPGSGRAPGQLMVFPTPQKYTETWKAPYIDIFTRMRDILNTKQTVLITLGFAFSDAHIRPMVEQCLKDNTFILVVLSKDMLPTFDSLRHCPNATIITQNLTITAGQEYLIPSNLWDFPSFVELLSHS